MILLVALLETHAHADTADTGAPPWWEPTGASAIESSSSAGGGLLPVTDAT